MNSINRNLEIVNLRNTGLSYAKIGEKYGISRERVRQIINSFNHKEERIPDEDYLFWKCLNDAAKSLNLSNESSLPIRTYNCLNKVGIIRHMRNTDTTLDDYSDDELLTIKGFGVNTLSLARIANDLYKQRI